MNELLQWLMSVARGAKCWIVVQPWERAVRVRLGRRAVLLGSGLHPRIPYADEVTIVNTRLRVAQVPTQTVTTRDGQVLTIGGNIGFQIDEPLAALNALQSPENTVAAIAQREVAGYISSAQRGDLTGPLVEAAVLGALRSFGTNKGLRFDFVACTDFAVVRTFRLLQEQWRPGTQHRDSL